MKTLFQQITAVIGLTVSLGLASCEKDGLLSPNPAGSARSGATNDVTLPSPNIPQVYKLTKYGDATLTYNADGRLRKVTQALTRGGQECHTDYTYAAGSVRAVTYKGQLVVRDETFTLDPSGRCTESVEEGNTLYNGAYFHYTTYWKFTYNAQGQLWSRQNKNSCVGGISYAYNADGDLILATVATSPSDGTAITFAYDQPVGDPILNDKYPLNVVGVNEQDTYLRIFGKPTKHLVKLKTEKSLLNNQVISNKFYAYTLNPDGYVTKKDEYNLFGAALTETKLYDYQVSDIGF